MSWSDMWLETVKQTKVNRIIPLMTPVMLLVSVRVDF